MKSIEQGSKEYANSLSSSEIFQIQHMKDFKVGAEFAQQFIPVEEEMPPAQIQVLVKCISSAGYEYIAMAQFIPSKTVLAGDFLSEEYDIDSVSEYDEEIDDYWVIEGWWEYQSVAEINWKISDKIIEWRPINKK